MDDYTYQDAEIQEGRHYWCLSGPLLKRDKMPTRKLDRLLRGIASSISSTFGQQDHSDLTPPQLSAFYRTVGGDYDLLFASTSPQSLGYIYKSLGCLHSLQPGPTDNGYASPSIPALKPKGFVTWQTIQILLGPEEHVPFLQRALHDFNVMDPDDGTPFPKYLPTDAFPIHPDSEMLAWHQKVSDSLRLEARAELQSQSSGRSSRDSSPVGHTDEREDAAKYFSNPLFRNRDGRPAIVDQIKKAPGQLLRGGQMVVHTMRNIADPHLWSGRRRSNDDADDSGDATPMGRPHHRHDHDSRHRSPRRSPQASPRRERSPSYSSVSEDNNRPRPTLRRHRSHEPPSSPREYFATTSNNREEDYSRRHQHQQEPRREQQQQEEKQQQPRRQQYHQHSQSADEFPNQEFRPSDSPPFVAKVAQLQPGYFDLRGRPANPPRSNHDYTSESPSIRSGRTSAPQASRTWSPGVGSSQSGFSSAPGDRPKNSQRFAPVKGVDGRRYPAEVPWR